MAPRKLFSVALCLEPARYLAGWRSDPGALFLPTLSDGRVGDEVAVRIGIVGQSIRATVLGTVSLVRRFGRPSLPPGVELTLDRMSLPAAKFLALAAQGEKVSFRERAPRFVFAKPLLVSRDREPLGSSTLNVSEGGCALRWPAGALPAVGEVLTIRFGEGFFAASARAVACWNAVDEGQRRVGVRVIAERRGAKAWRSIVDEAAYSGGGTL
jgi:Tfp pilus assembly protein PilZ